MTAQAIDCPFTKKAMYRTKADAWRDIAGDMGRPTPDDYDLRPFKCQCGKWHVSSMEFVALRRWEDTRSWTIFVKKGKVGFHLKGPHNRGIAVELTPRDTLEFMWGLVKAAIRSLVVR